MEVVAAAVLVAVGGKDAPGGPCDGNQRDHMTEVTRIILGMNMTQVHMDRSITVDDKHITFHRPDTADLVRLVH